MKLRTRIVFMVTALLMVAVLAVSWILTSSARKTLLQQTERYGQHLADQVSRSASIIESLPEEIEKVIGEQMVVGASLAAELVAIAESAGESPDKTRERLKRITQNAHIDEIWITDETGRAYLNTAGIDFTFSPDPNIQPQASAFYPLLKGEKKVVIQDAMKREVDERIFKYAGVGGVDKPRIVQFGYKADILERIERDFGTERILSDLVQLDQVLSMRVIGADRKIIAQAAKDPGTPLAFDPREAAILERVLQTHHPESFLEGSVLNLAVPLGREHGKIAFIELEVDHLQAILHRNVKLAAQAAALILALGAGASLLLARHISLPVEELRHAATALEEEDYARASTRLDQIRDRHDELGHLAGAFCRMINAVRQRDAQLEDQNAHLDKLVADRTAELEITRDRAEEANRTKSAFLANMSHELRTPMNAIIGYSEMLMEEGEEIPFEEMQDDLKKIHGAGKHLLSLINDVLDISKIEAGKMTLYLETFALGPMLDEVAATVSPLMAKNENRLVVNYPPDFGSIHADLTKVRQTLFNLLSNAGKFTEKGTITLDAFRNGSQYTFRVRDTGIGMSPQQMKNLFTAFTQADASTSRKYGGTGLGLAISKRFCEMMGGDLQVTSEIGKGATFTVSLPEQVEESSEPVAVLGAPEPPLRAPTPQADGPLVLVVEDDPMACDLFFRVLNKEGYRVEIARDGVTALEMARSLQPNIITLDVMMPSMDGLTVLSTLKDDPITKEIPVVMISMNDDRNLGLSLGAADYLTKPVERSRLLEALQRHGKENEPRLGLVVDDLEANRELLRHSLEREGWEVAEAINGHDALDKIAEREPNLILLDLMMPEMDGFEFLTILRSRKLEIPVIVVTARTLEQGEYAQLRSHLAEVIQRRQEGQETLLSNLEATIRTTLQRDQKRTGA